MEENLIQEAWDKKKIFVGFLIIVLLISLGFGAKILVLDKNQTLSNFLSKDKVKGLSVQGKIITPSELQTKPLSLPSTNNIKTEAEKKLDEVKQEINSLDITEIASSSPQVKKILNDIKSLEQYPRNQAKDICQEICKGL